MKIRRPLVKASPPVALALLLALSASVISGVLLCRQVIERRDPFFQMGVYRRRFHEKETRYFIQEMMKTKGAERLVTFLFMPFPDNMTSAEKAHERSLYDSSMEMTGEEGVAAADRFLKGYLSTEPARPLE